MHFIPILKIAAKNRRNIVTVLKAEAVHIQAWMHPYMPKTILKYHVTVPLKEHSRISLMIFKLFADTIKKGFWTPLMVIEMGF